MAHGGEVARADLREGLPAAVRPVGGFPGGGDEQIGHPLHGGEDHRCFIPGRGLCGDGGHGADARAVGQ